MVNTLSYGCGGIDPTANTIKDNYLPNPKQDNIDKTKNNPVQKFQPKNISISNATVTKLKFTTNEIIAEIIPPITYSNKFL